MTDKAQKDDCYLTPKYGIKMTWPKWHAIEYFIGGPNDGEVRFLTVEDVRRGTWSKRTQKPLDLGGHEV